MESIIRDLLTPAYVSMVIRVTTPILFAALAALVAEKSGLFNIGVEGIMLIAALTGVVVSAKTGNTYVGLLAAIVAGSLGGFMIAYAVISLKTDAVISGIAMNMIGSGGTVFLLYILTGNKGISSTLKSGVIPAINIPLIKDIPILGEIISGQNLMTYLAFLMVYLMWFFLNKTPLGLRIRAVGENEHAADSVGVFVDKTRYIALLISGALAGMGGAYMSMGYVSWFSKDMTAGRGFIGLAAMTLGGVKPVGSMVASLLFGMADALSNYLQSIGLPSLFLLTIPYIVTLLGLVLYAVRKKQQLAAKSKPGEAKAGKKS